MSEKTPAERLFFKPGMTASLRSIPPLLEGRLGLPPDVASADGPGSADFVLEFVGTQSEAETGLSALGSVIGPNTVAWIAYPKGSKAAGHDLNRDTVAAFARTIGLVAVSAISIDATWSALRIRPLKPGE